MRLNQLALPALALCLGFTAPCTARALGAPAPAPAAYGQQPGWDEPPQELQEMQRRGFRDGIAAAHQDIESHRHPDFNNRDEFRNPGLPHEQWEAYRDGFRRGYERGVSYLMGAQQGPPPPQMQQGPPAPPMEQDFGRDARRHGFQDGVEGALRDLDNHRRPDPDNRDEFRNPRVPPEFREPYRQGFRRGYQLGITELMSGGQGGGGFWRGSDVQHRGFRDGMEGALRDRDNRRAPDPNNRDEYRHPSVPGELAEEYREGFRHGYQVGASELEGGHIDDRDGDRR